MKDFITFEKTITVTLILLYKKFKNKIILVVRSVPIFENRLFTFDKSASRQASQTLRLSFIHALLRLLDIFLIIICN